MNGSNQRQKQFNFDALPRGDKLRMLDELELQTHHLQRSGKPVSAAMQKAVLRAIDNRARGSGVCFEGAASMASVVGCSVKTIERTRQALLEQSLIACHDKPSKNPSGKVTHHYVIVWSEVALRTGHYSKARQERTDTGANRTDNGSERTDTGADRTDNGFLHKEEALLSASEAQLTASPSPLTKAVPVATAWDEAAAEVFACGVSEFRQAISHARRNRLTPTDVLRLCEVYRQHRNTFDTPGALFEAIKKFLPGQSPTDARFWPTDVSPPNPQRSQAASQELRAVLVQTMRGAGVDLESIDRELNSRGYEPLSERERRRHA